MGSVNIKGTGSGLILDLAKDVSFEQIRTDAVSKFCESSSFLGKSSVGLMIRGRQLSDEEEQQILQIISENCNINITCVLRDDPETDAIFAKYTCECSKVTQEENFETMADNNADEVTSEDVGSEASPGYETPDNLSAKIYKGSLRSGQTLTIDQSVIIMGDVKPGATVTARGSIFVLGALRGTVYAGSDGDENTFVMAMEMDPLQIRIANAIAISPDADKGPRLRNRRFRKKNDDKGPEIAYILNGHVVKDKYGSSFLRVNKF